MASFNAQIDLTVNSSKSEKKVKQLERNIQKVEGTSRKILGVDKRIVQERRKVLQLQGESRRAAQLKVRNSENSQIEGAVWSFTARTEQITWSTLEHGAG